MKKKILLISDDVRAHSGVGTMARYIFEDTKDVFDWIMIGSLATHPDKGKVIEYNDAKIYCDERFGSIELIRHIMRTDKPDAIMLFTDPRFFGHVFAHEEEIRTLAPIIYYNIWDAGPAPKWNLGAWGAVDHLAAISRQTYALNAHVVPNVPRSYVPHGADLETYHPVPDAEAEAWFAKEIGRRPGSFRVLYVNRNIRRKQTADVALAVTKLIERTGNENIDLIFRTEAVDPDGTDLPAVLDGIGFRGNAFFIGAREAKDMKFLYSVADVTVNIASNEGFGITTIESLACGTPILVNMTGGLQDQVGLLKPDGSPVTLADYTPEWYTNADGRFRHGGEWADFVFPAVRSVNGSPLTPYVLQEFAAVPDVVDRLEKIYGETREERKARGLKGRDFLIRSGMTRVGMAKGITKAINETLEDFVPRAKYEIVDPSTRPYDIEAGHVSDPVPVLEGSQFTQTGLISSDDTQTKEVA